MRTALLAAAAAVLLGAACSAQPGNARAYVWWEGEKPLRTNFPKRTWFSPTPQEAKLLSGGDWLTSDGKRGAEQLYATYRVEVPRAGRWHLWVRKFWKHGPFRWRFGNGQWHVCGRDCALADNVTLRTHVCANWVYLGEVELPAGPATFELRLLAGPGESAVAAFDCFILVQGAFIPNGKLKPGEKYGLSEPGYFAYEPSADAFTNQALLDLRSLNEKVAGQNGFVRREGDHFVLGSGRPVRFWAVNVGPNIVDQPPPTIDYLVRGLAKRGVNMIRYHGPIFASGPDPARVDEKRLRNIHYFVAACRRNGVYVYLSFYFPLWFTIKPSYGIPGFENFGNKRPFALIFFDPKLQQIYRSWLRALLTTPNPFTGRSLSRETAVAIIELVNEDSFFFWTFSKRNIPPVHWQRLERMFCQWLAKRYGSAERAIQAWGGLRLPGDDPAAGRMALYEIWHLTRDGLKAGPPTKAKRAADQARFLAELQRRFYEDTIRFIKRDLGYGGLVNCSNWKTADAALLEPLEHWTYAAGDMIDRHGYFSPPHKGQGASYSVRVGHTYRDRAGVLEPEKTPLQFAQLADMPQIISEIGWPNPNRFKAESCPLAAAYGALQGVDGIFWFAVASPYLRDTDMAKFTCTTPSVLASFPACALMFRRGDVQEAEAVLEALRLADLFALKGCAVVSEAALDKLRAADIPPGAQVRGPVEAIDPLAFFVGRVAQKIADEPGQSTMVDLRQFIDRGRKIVRSRNGQLAWDYARGLVTINTPRTQGAVGFLARAGKIQLRDVAIDCRNEFAAVLITSLDDQPLARSRRILIQCVTEDKPYGFTAQSRRIENLGGPPMQVRLVDCTVALPGRLRAVPLDENGYRAADGSCTVRTRGDRTEIRLAPNCLWHVAMR